MNEYLVVVLLKNFFINVFTYYTFFKILNINEIKKIKVLVVSVILTIIYAVTKIYLDTIFAIIFTYFAQIIFIRIIFGINQEGIITTNIVASSLSYVIFTLSTIFESILKIVFDITNHLMDLFLILLIEMILSINLFRLNRFKYGLKFLQNGEKSDYLDIIMINISAVVMLAYCLFGDFYGDVTKQIFLAFIIISIIMIIMIQKTLTLYYKQKLLHQTIEDYKTEIADKDKKIKELSDEKYKISKLNHEFYNRQKALEKKVADYISNVSEETANELAITEQIADLSKEYSDKLQNIKHPDKLPATEIEEIDDMFKYMQSECEKNNIEFKLQINGNIHHMINQIIPKDKLVTLIGDHLRDAIIAINSSNNSFKSIIAILGKADEFYEFCVFDTGIEFELETLLALGTKPITTHKDTGGTGYGFMTTFETLRETKGSLVIEEKHKMSENDYTKAVRIIFDGKAQYRISSYRMKEQNKSIL